MSRIVATGKIKGQRAMVKNNERTYQNKGCAVEKIPPININALCNFLLANLEIPSSTCVTKLFERLAEVKGIIFFQLPRLDQSPLIV